MLGQRIICVVVLAGISVSITGCGSGKSPSALRRRAGHGSPDDEGAPALAANADSPASKTSANLQHAKTDLSSKSASSPQKNADKPAAKADPVPRVAKTEANPEMFPAATGPLPPP